ncbi:MAG: hypothetical protein EXR31_09115 [Betaproteobacteria bacterium]|nr:hypothetical protein [Betaproteobacteria bacterium]
MGLILRALKAAIGAFSATKTVSRTADRGGITDVPLLTELPHVAANSRHVLKPLYGAYLREVSNSAWVISFETACVLYGLCTLVKPAAILDLGTGFTSAAFRSYAKTATHQCRVASVDDDSQWLERTREFLVAKELSTTDLMLWPAFLETSCTYDLILHDLGNMTTREQALETALARRATNGLLVLDDMQFEPYGSRARNTCEAQRLGCFDLCDLTTDSFGRYATLVLAP